MNHETTPISGINNMMHVERMPKSVELTPEELKALRKFRIKSKTNQATADALGIHLSSTVRILKLGSGSAVNVQKIREYFSTTEQPVENEQEQETIA